MYNIVQARCHHCLRNYSPVKIWTNLLLKNSAMNHNQLLPCLLSRPINNLTFKPRNFLSKPFSSPALVNQPISGVRNKSDSYILRKLKKYGFFRPKGKFRVRGVELYALIIKQIDVEHFFKVLQLPDTFSSFFSIVNLHVWMLMLRLIDEGEDGKYVRYSLVEAMWDDMEVRIKKIGGISQRKEQLELLGGQFQASLFSYDEGINGNDMVLASALWRSFFFKNCEDPECLEACLQYVRQQVCMLDELSTEDIMGTKLIHFMPLLSCKGIKNL